MALRLYLKQEVREQVLQQHGEGNRRIIEDYDAFDVNGIKVKLDSDGRPYYDVHNDRVPLALLVPHALKDSVEYFNWLLTLWPNCPTREPGIYAYESAEATLEPPKDNGRGSTANIHGPQLDHVYELMRAIRAGRAEMIESWRWEAEPEVTGGNPALIAEATGNPDVANMSDEDAKAYMDMLSSGAEEEANAYFATVAANPNRQPTAAKYAKIQCRECKAKYTINADKTAGRSVKIVCRTCGAHIHVTDGQVVDSVPYSSRRNGQGN